MTTDTTARTTWTPGPWQLSRYTSAFRKPRWLIHAPAANSALVAEITCPPTDAAEGDAVILAAAPEMAEALQEAEGLLAFMVKTGFVGPNDVVHPRTARVLDRARSLLARIEGER